MTTKQCALLADLELRGLVAQQTGDGGLGGHLNENGRSVYCGFDPTAESLHIGSLVPLLALRRFQLAGHKPIALVGGATGLIGDPSGKSEERNLNTPDIVSGWAEKLKTQISCFIDFDSGDCSAAVVNNLDWVGGYDLLRFLREIGKHFAVNAMIHKESVKQRIEREGAGISYTEFSYMLLQSLDFMELNKRHDCTVQIGGSDQWGNIVEGIELTRRRNHARVYGMTLPLVTKTDGSKFGKTEVGTVWLDAAKTSPYAFYQFWLNSADADAYKFLRYFTFLPVTEIDDIDRSDREQQGRPEAQGVLAGEVTGLVHGQQGLEAARRISKAMFDDRLTDLSESDLEQLKLDGLPSTEIKRDCLQEGALTQLLTEAGMVKAGREVKDALKRNAVLINGEPKSLQDNMNLPSCFDVQKAAYQRFYIVKLGKKKYHLFDVRR